MKIPSLHIVGVSYKNANAIERGKFSLDQTNSKKLLLDAARLGIESIVVNSTCNRVEIYAYINNFESIIDLLCKHSHGKKSDFENIGYNLEGDVAIEHLFSVGTGLDSQILGDFEIIAQLRKSFKNSKDLGLVNPYFDRLFSTVMQASKRIKNETKLST